jgi:HTH-type transcriptional regulator / antitoxin HipB
MLKSIGLEELKDKHLGKIGTPGRDQYEYELSIEILAEQIKQLRKERKLTQEQLGALVGVQRAQISKWENNTDNVTIGTILKVFSALNAKLNFTIEKQEKVRVRQRAK